MNSPRTLIARSLLSALALSAAARAHPDAPKPQETQPKPAERAPRPDPLPGLDELLGLEPAEKPATERDAPPADQAQRELERRLKDQQINHIFEEAVTLMDDVALRIERAVDVGIDTQRLQEDILRRLDAVIADAEARRQQSSASSSSQADQQSSSPPRQRPGSQQQAQNDESPSPDGGENVPPAHREGRLRDLGDAGSAAWGALPERIRETLLQGAGDRFSALYEALTEEYYRRLAEQRPEE